MHRLLQPMFNNGFFESVTLDRNRIYTQILDNLNKSAIVGFPVEEIGVRLMGAQSEDPAQPRLYADAQECALRFREFCLQNNLLDYSLQIQTFKSILWPSILFQKYFYSLYQYLIFDNVEEDVPIVHDLVTEWLQNFRSSLLIYDTQGGYRSFLGADPDSGVHLAEHAHLMVVFPRSRIPSPSLQAFTDNLSRVIHHRKILTPPHDMLDAIEISRHRFLPQMVDWVIARVQDLIRDDQTPENGIAVLVPFLSDTLDFYLKNKFIEAGIKAVSRRPSRSLQEEPFTNCVLTLAKIAHPQWNLPVSQLDLRSAFVQIFKDIDLVRIDLLCKIVYRLRQNSYSFSTYEEIQPTIQKRLTQPLGEKYSKFIQWLSLYQSSPTEELDYFVNRLFSELLVQPGFDLETNYDVVNQVYRLIESIQKFNLAYRSVKTEDQSLPGIEYIKAVEMGLISAQYITEWVNRPSDAVVITPAFTFLMENRAVDYQFWLDIGSPGWWERLYQPLTHPVVLSRRWQPDYIWSDADEIQFTEDQLARITHGLTMRCRKKILMSYLMLDARGSEQRGLFLTALQKIYRQFSVRETLDV